MLGTYKMPTKEQMHGVKADSRTIATQGVSILKSPSQFSPDNPMGTHRKHTPITSKKQRGFFGAELARKRAGKRTRTEMPEAELVRHLKESKGKRLPKRA